MFPGGAFRGQGAPCPTSWERFTAALEVELEVWPDAARSITVWSVVHEGVLHVPGDFLTPWKRWPQQVMEDPRVRVRIRDEIFDCRAERVEDDATALTLRRAIGEKYDIAPDGIASRTEVWWFAMRAR